MVFIVRLNCKVVHRNFMALTSQHVMLQLVGIEDRHPARLWHMYFLWSLNAYRLRWM